MRNTLTATAMLLIVVAAYAKADSVITLPEQLKAGGQAQRQLDALKASREALHRHPKIAECVGEEGRGIRPEEIAERLCRHGHGVPVRCEDVARTTNELWKEKMGAAPDSYAYVCDSGKIAWQSNIPSTASSKEGTDSSPNFFFHTCHAKAKVPARLRRDCAAGAQCYQRCKKAELCCPRSVSQKLATGRGSKKSAPQPQDIKFGC